MIEITIAGPAGAGKTLVGNLIAAVLKHYGMTVEHDGLPVASGEFHRSGYVLKTLGIPQRSGGVKIATTNAPATPEPHPMHEANAEMDRLLAGGWKLDTKAMVAEAQRVAQELARSRNRNKALAADHAAMSKRLKAATLKPTRAPKEVKKKIRRAVLWENTTKSLPRSTPKVAEWTLHLNSHTRLKVYQTAFDATRGLFQSEILMRAGVGYDLHRGTPDLLTLDSAKRSIARAAQRLAYSLNRKD